MNNIGSGGYVVYGTKGAGKYLRRHFSKFFVFWIFLFVDLISKITIFLNPAIQKFKIELSHQVNESSEAIFSKCFDQSNHKRGYRSLLLFNLLVFTIDLAALIFFFLLAFFLRHAVMNIYLNATFSPDTLMNFSFFPDFFSTFSYSSLYMVDDAIMNVDTVTMLFYIPFGIMAFLVLFYSLMVIETGTFVSYKNPDLNLGDMFYNALNVIKIRGGKLFAINILYLLEFLTLAVIVILPQILFSYFTAYWFYDEAIKCVVSWVYGLVTAVISLFVIPYIVSGFHLSIYKFNCDYTQFDTIIVSYKRNDSKKDTAFIPLTRIEDENGEVKYVDLESKPKKKKEEK